MAKNKKHQFQIHPEIFKAEIIDKGRTTFKDSVSVSDTKGLRRIFFILMSKWCFPIRVIYGKKTREDLVRDLKKK